MSKTLKSLAAGAAIVASIGAGANSQVSADEVVSNSDTSTETVVSTTEIKVAKEAKTAEDVKPALDAQKEVVKSTQADVEAAKSEVDTAKSEVKSAQSQADAADQAVKDAESAMTNATPENIAANQDEQALNLQDQKNNATDTENVNKAIVDQQAKVASAQADVDTAKSEKDQADASVKAAESEVASAQDALSGKGLESAKETLNQANQDVKSAEANVASAQDALTKAKQDSQEREAAIKAAQTDVNVKTDAVNTASAKVSAAQSKVASSDKNLQSATKAVKAAQDALNALGDVDNVSFNAENQTIERFKMAYDEVVTKGNQDQLWKNTMVGYGVKMAEGYSVDIRESDKTRSIDVLNLTNEEKIEISKIYVEALNQLREMFGQSNKANVTQAAINLANDKVQAYEERGESPLIAGHIGSGSENLVRLGSVDTNTITDMKRLKEEVFDSFEATSFEDEPSNWGHLRANLHFADNIGLNIANINGELWLVIAFSQVDDTTIANSNDTAQLEAALKQAKADQAAAQTASDAAKAELAKVSADYATALELKTQAEKVLADAMATPLETQVAENNLRLANLALQNAKERQVAAKAAVDNFSADLGTKEAALESAKAKLAEAQTVANEKAQALEITKAELANQENTLQLLNDDKAQLLAEKDRLVEEAKALAEELDSYLNAESNLATAKVNQEAAQTALKDAQAKLDELELKLADVTARLEDETAILTELQAEYDSLKALEPKEDTSKDTKVTLPDGKTITVSKDKANPSAKSETTSDAATLARLKAILAAREALQKSHTNENNQALYNAVDAYIHQGGAVKKTAKSDDEVGMLARKLGYVSLGVAPSASQKAEALNFIKSEIARLEAKVAKGKGNVANKGQLTTSKATQMTGVSQWNSVTVTKPQAGVTVTITVNGSTTSYSRVARAEALPQTGEQESLVALLGVAVLSGLGLTGVRRKRMG